MKILSKKIMEVNGKRIFWTGAFMFLVGFMLVYGPMVYEYLQTGKIPGAGSFGVGIGNILMVLGPWLIKGRNAVRRAVN